MAPASLIEKVVLTFRASSWDVPCLPETLGRVSFVLNFRGVGGLEILTLSPRWGRYPSAQRGHSCTSYLIAGDGTIPSTVGCLGRMEGDNCSRGTCQDDHGASRSPARTHVLIKGPPSSMFLRCRSSCSCLPICSWDQDPTRQPGSSSSGSPGSPRPTANPRCQLESCLPLSCFLIFKGSRCPRRADLVPFLPVQSPDPDSHAIYDP